PSRLALDCRILLSWEGRPGSARHDRRVKVGAHPPRDSISSSTTSPGRPATSRRPPGRRITEGLTGGLADAGSPPAYDTALVGRVLGEARREVSVELERVLAERRRTGYGPLYELLADYPFREGKGLRPAICLAACRAAGGRTEQVILSATALELF